MAGLHRKRKRDTSTDDYAAMLRRMVRAYGRRTRENHLAGLGHLREIETELTDAVNLALFEANRVDGVSINQLAAELRVSKQAIHKRVDLGAQIAAHRDARLTSPTRIARPPELATGVNRRLTQGRR